MNFNWKRKSHLLGKLQDDVFLLENICVIRRRIILELHQFDVVILNFFEHVEYKSSI